MNNHVTRFSDSSFYDEVCVNCGETDWGEGLRGGCRGPLKYATTSEYYDERKRMLEEYKKEIEKLRATVVD